MFVKPGPNPDLPGTMLKVRDPVTFRLLQEEGAEVPANAHWLRALRDGDVMLADEEATA